jgi:hypothetical protein
MPPLLHLLNPLSLVLISGSYKMHLIINILSPLVYQEQAEPYKMQWPARHSRTVSERARGVD